MRFDESDRVDESQIEDRRRGGGFARVGAGLGGLGIIGTLAAVAVRLLSGDSGGAASELTRALEGTRRARPAAAAKRGSGAIGGSCQGVTSKTDSGKFVACVETNVQSFWKREFARRGDPYRGAKLVLFSNETTSGCGDASASTGPFYCPADHKIFLDLGFFRDLTTRFGAQGGDFAEAYVVAHEYGHHVQNLLGIEPKVRDLQRKHPKSKNRLSVKLELQADCFAGAWGHAAYEKGKVEEGEIDQALDAAAAVGDDRLQQRAHGRVAPETFTHGSADERRKWFRRGWDAGDPAACDTFDDEKG
ncbi:MAG TPA: neutral zinc metallopeptidase [Polyangiaceae bacterium]|nr:neutral zinc metallopeptidase [Polyangiaceae bacterium]